MKKERIIKTVMLSLSAFVLICYLPYLLLLLTNGERFSSCFIALSVVLAASVPAVLFVKFNDKLGRVLKGLRAVYICGMAFYFITFSAFFAYIGVCSRSDADSAAEVLAEKNDGTDVVLVFGCRTYGYTPGVNLKSRLDSAVTLLEALPDAVCVVSGGQGQNETIPEAESMRAYLESCGIEPSRIFIEENSFNTYDNIERSVELLDKLGIDDPRIIGVSSEFHIPRIEYLFNYYEVEAETVAAPSPGFGFYFMSVVREYMAYVKLFFVTAF